MQIGKWKGLKEEVIEAFGYDAQRDVENPCGSVFCAHGAGFVVEWEQVEAYMHLESALPDKVLGAQGQAGHEADVGIAYSSRQDRRKSESSAGVIGQDEIEEIMNRTYGVKEPKKQGWARTVRAGNAYKAQGGTGAGQKRESYGNRKNSGISQEEYLLVDGYNIIFAWESLKELAQVNLDSARGRLMDILSNFQGYRKMHLILVFDAYKVKGNPGSTVRYHNIDVVYTKEAETADQYIEKVTHEIGRKHYVRVATSDGLEQLIIMGAGAIRVSARELLEEVMAAGDELRQMFLAGSADRAAGDKNYLLEGVSEEVADYVEQVRQGREPER